MSGATHTDKSSGDQKQTWLEIAETIKSKAPAPPVYRHARSKTASVKRLRELAGIIKLNRPVPSRKFIKG